MLDGKVPIGFKNHVINPSIESIIIVREKNPNVFLKYLSGDLVLI